VVVAVNGPVLSEPEVPVTARLEEEQKVVLGDDQLILVLELYAIEVEPAETYKVGGVETTVVAPSRGPPHAPITRLKNIIDTVLVTLKFNEFIMFCSYSNVLNLAQTA